MNTRLVRTVTAVGLLLVTVSALQAGEKPVAKRPEGASSNQAEVEPWRNPDPAALKRWQDMRFGTFRHWGPVSRTGHEIGWSRGAQTPIEKYDNFYQEFNPTRFDAGQWVAVAKVAGMKYLVLTTKHHDGFCLWDTKQTDFNIMRSPFGRDMTKELAEACKRAGIAFGTYHSVPA
jgi:alpha-L-fucosidase